MGAYESSNSSMDIPVDPNRRPVDDPKTRRRLQQQQAQQQAQQGMNNEIGADAHPYLPPQPRKYPEPTD